MSEPTTTENQNQEEVQETKNLETSLRDLARDIKNFESLDEQRAELEKELSDLGDELIGLIKGDEPKAEDRTEAVVAAERKRAERKLERLKEKSDPVNLKTAVQSVADQLDTFVAKL